MKLAVAVCLCFTLSVSSVAAKPPRRASPKASLAFGTPPQISSTDEILLFAECDNDQCIRTTGGGGGALWVFEGRKGEGIWAYGAQAGLILNKLTAETIIVRREDPNNTYSSQFVHPGTNFTATYTGTIGDEIVGSVKWGDGPQAGTGHWSARMLRSGRCEAYKDPWTGCHLNNAQIVQLGQNAVKAQLYRAAFKCFKIASDHEDGDGLGLAGSMMITGTGTARDPLEGMRLLQEGAEFDSYFAEASLAEVYRKGIGVPADLKQADYWTKKAQARQQEMEYQASRQQAAAQGPHLTLSDVKDVLEITKVLIDIMNSLKSDH